MRTSNPLTRPSRLRLGLQPLAFSLLLAVLAFVQPAAHAGVVIKAATGTDLTDPASWGGTAPGSGDVAAWASTSLGASLTLGTSSSWGGINVASALGAIGVTGAGTLTLGSGGINMWVSTVNLTLGTPIALGTSQTWNVNSGRTLAASGIISGTSMGLTKDGLGTLTLTGANTYDGTTTINAGTLVADTPSTATILNSASGLTFTSSGTFQLKGLASNARSQILNGLTLTGGAAIIDANNTGTSTTIDLRGTGGTLTIARSAGTTVDFKATTGTLGTTALVNTAQANDGTGILGAWATVNTGADWAINSSGVAAAYTGYNTLSGTTLATGGTVNYRVASNPTTPTGNITMAATGTIDVNTLRISDAAARTIDVRNGATQGILRFGAVGGLLTSGGSHIIGVSGTGTAGTITAGGADNTAGELIVNNATALAINSVIANNGSGAVSLTKSGAGTLTLNGTGSTYSGGTIINSGTVSLLSTVNTTIGTGPITVNSGGKLNLSRNQINRDLTLRGGTLAGGGGWGDVSWAGTITLAANSTFDFSDYPSNINAPVSGSGGLTKITAGQLLLNNALNNYTGPTFVSAGVLQFKYSFYGNDTAQWNPTNITVASGAVLRLNVGGSSEFTTSQFATLWANLTTVQNNGLLNGSLLGIDTRNAGATVQTVSATLTDSTGPGGGAVGLRHIGVSGGTLELTGPNTYTGRTSTDNNGWLKVSSLNSITNNPALGTVHSASSSLGAPTNAANGTIYLGGLESMYVGANLLYTGTGETTDRVINLGGANGTTFTFDQSGSGLLKFISAFTITDNRGPKTIVLQGSTAGKGEVAGVIPLGQSTASPNHLTKSGTGTWILSAPNANASGVYTVAGGALVLNDPGALPGAPTGIGVSGGICALVFGSTASNGGVIGLGTGDFTRNLGNTGTTNVLFTGNGGWAAYGTNRAVNLGSASAQVVWGTAVTGLNGKILILGNATATHTLDFQNPLDLGNATRTVQVDDGAAAIDGKLSGNITGIAGGNLSKTGLGTLALTGNNNYVGTTTVSAGCLLVNGTNSGTGLFTVASGATNGGTGTIMGPVTYSSGAKAVFTVTPDPISSLTNLTPLTIAGAMTYNANQVVLNAPANLPSGTYILAASSVAATANGVFPTPALLTGSYAPGFTSATVSLDGSGMNLILTVTGYPTTPTQLAVASVNGGTSPTAQVGFPVVVQAQDANGAPRLVSTDTVVQLNKKVGSYLLYGTLTGTIPGGSSSGTISGVKYLSADTGVVLTATNGPSGSLLSGDSAPFNVLANTTPSYLTVTGFPSPQTAGTAGSVTVTAYTVGGSVATTYAGTIQFSSSAVTAGFPTSYTFVPATDNGVHTFTGVSLQTAGTRSITATDTVTPTVTGTQSGIIVTPANASALAVAGCPSPTTTNVPGSVTVTAQDAYANTATNYTGTIAFTSSDSLAGLPGNYTFLGGDLGVRTFTNGVTFNTLGTNSITATDMGTPSITGAQSNIVVWIWPTLFTWTNSAGGNWSAAANWTNDQGVVFAPLTNGQPNYTLSFGPGSYTAIHNLANGFFLNQLNFAGAVTLDSPLGYPHGLTFTTNGQTLPQINQKSGSGVLVNNALSLATNLTFGGTGNGGVTLFSAISGAGGLIVTNPNSILYLGSANTYSGGTLVNAGTIAMSVAFLNNPLGSGLATFNSGTAFELGAGVCTNAFTLNGATVRNGNGFSGHLNGPIYLGATSTVDLSGNLQIAGDMSGPGGLIKLSGNSQNPLILSGNNSYTGTNFVMQGILQFNSTNSVGSAGLSISTGAKAGLSYSGDRVIPALWLNGMAQPSGTYGATTNGAAYFAGAGTVTVGGALAPLTPPVLDPSTGYSIVSGNPSLTFTAQNGYYYRLVYSADVAAPLSTPWTPVVNSPPTYGWVQASADGLMTLVDPNGTSFPQRFYVIQVSATPTP